MGAEAYHTPRMISKCVSTGVHQPVIRVTDGPFIQSVKRIPGFAHVAQNHIYGLVMVVPSEISSGCRFWAVLGVLTFEIAGLDLFDFHLVHRFLEACWVGTQEERLPQSAAVGVAKERFDLGLNIWGEEIALNGRDAFRRLNRDQVDAQNSSSWLGKVDCDLSSPLGSGSRAHYGHERT